MLQRKFFLNVNIPQLLGSSVLHLYTLRGASMTAKLTFKVQAKTFDMELDTELTVADVLLASNTY